MNECLNYGNALSILYFCLVHDAYRWCTYMQPLSTFSDCRSKALCCRSFDQQREVNIQSDRNTVCWQYPERPRNIPGNADLVTSAQIPALSSRTVRFSSDHSEHSASRLHHCHDNGARTSHRCSTQWHYYLRHQKTKKQLISIDLFHRVSLIV